MRTFSWGCGRSQIMRAAFSCRARSVSEVRVKGYLKAFRPVSGRKGTSWEIAYERRQQ